MKTVPIKREVINVQTDYFSSCQKDETNEFKFKIYPEKSGDWTVTEEQKVSLDSHEKADVLLCSMMSHTNVTPLNITFYSQH